MKSELDMLMHSKDIDAILVIGNATHNPAMYYLTGGGHVSSATLIKPRDSEPILYYHDMERDEAAKTGLKLIPYSTYNFNSILKEANGDFAMAQAVRYKSILIDQNIHGRIGIYGFIEYGSAFAVFSLLQQIMPDIELVGETNDDSIFMKAMETKDTAEFEHIFVGAR